MQRTNKINAIHWLRDIIANDKTIKTSGEHKRGSTMETYLIVLKDFQTFLKEKGQDTISFDDINLALIKEYETYLFNKKVKGERTTATSTVGNKCVQLIGIIKRAEPYNLIDIHEAKLDKYSKPKSRQGDENEKKNIKNKNSHHTNNKKPNIHSNNNNSSNLKQPKIKNHLPISNKN